MSAARLRLIRGISSEIFAGVGPSGGLLGAPDSVVVPIALEGGRLIVFTYPTGTASRIDQAEGRLRQALGERGFPVDEIVTLEVSQTDVLLAQAISDIDVRLAKQEGTR